MHNVLYWINQNAAGLTAIFTFLYLIATVLIFSEARKSADAAEKSAAAAGKSADAAQQSIDPFATQEFATQRGLTPRIVKDLIQETYILVGYWLGHAAHIAPPPFGNPDPKGLEKHSLLRAADLARTFSDQCAQLIVQASANIKMREK